MALGPLRRLVRAEPRARSDPVPQPRPSLAPTSGVRLAHVGPESSAGRAPLPASHRRPRAGSGATPRTLVASEALWRRARPRGSPVLTSLRPQVPGTQLRAAQLGRGSWGRAPDAPPLPYLRRGGGGGAGPWGRDRALGRGRALGAGPGPGGGAPVGPSSPAGRSVAPTAGTAPPRPAQWGPCRGRALGSAGAGVFRAPFSPRNLTQRTV